MYRAAGAVFTAAGSDPAFGPQLIRSLKAAGLQNITPGIHTSVVAGGTENRVRGTVEHLRERRVGTGLVTAGDVQRFLTLTAGQSCHYAPPSWSPSGPGVRPRDHARIAVFAAGPDGLSENGAPGSC
jgi:hypothetical protein